MLMKEMASSSWISDSITPSSSRYIPLAHTPFVPCGGNVFTLLVRREISPQSRHRRKMHWGEASKFNIQSPCHPKSEKSRDARRGLDLWVEEESLKHLSARYCSLMPPPRSTIAAAFSSDGRTLASTHGDHTVKIIDYQSGRCLKVLTGHRRTPWVVRFHPLCPEILASGSLDHEVHVWDANTSNCIESRDFYRPIASIAFHANGQILAVASGHKLYMWNYRKRGDNSSPVMILKTRRSLRAVHFHPHGAPFLLTAEVSDLDTSDTSMSKATSAGYLHYPPPAVFLANIVSRDVLSLLHSEPSPTQSQSYHSITTQSDDTACLFTSSPMTPECVDEGVEILTTSLVSPDGFSLSGVAGRSNTRSQFSRVRFLSLSDSRDIDAARDGGSEVKNTQLVVSRIQAEVATSLAAAAAAELPCTVKLRIWPHNEKSPCALLSAERCRLCIPHAVLCSEMGAHFSPCGKFLAACVACLSHTDSDPVMNSRTHQDSAGLATSPTRHPISAHQVIYELRIYSLEEATFGSVLVSRAIRAAHCLTSIQFSPTSEHILLAYGRRHSSLLKSIVMDGETTLPIYTILEVYRVSDMELVRELPSSDDEVNVACFHPSAGGGLIYGTKEGKLRVLQFDGAHCPNCTGTSFLFEENMIEFPSFALEC